MGAMKKSVHTPEYARLRSLLRDARAKAGLSQRELAARLDVPHSWIAKVENGERRIDLIEFGWFLSACGVDPQSVSEKLLRQIVKRQTETRGRGGPSK
jgi:transcriptional regulator with XRE-family HTH domain